MNERDIQIAFQAGFVSYELEDYTDGGYDIRYERFAELIRADEREACLNCYSPDDTATDWADKIRKRGNTCNL